MMLNLHASHQFHPNKKFRFLFLSLWEKYNQFNLLMMPEHTCPDKKAQLIYKMITTMVLEMNVHLGHSIHLNLHLQLRYPLSYSHVWSP